MSGTDLAAESRKLVLANRILARHGVVDAFGHASRRDPANPARFFLSRNMAPARVTEGDVVEFDLDGNAVSHPDARVYLERYIHAEIYRARPDVSAVVHSHADAVIPFGAARHSTLRPLWHMCGFLGDCAPVYEIRDHAGPASNMLISSSGLGRSLAEALGQRTTILMRGHGATVVGSTLPQAVFRAIYMMRNAQMQLSASALGELTFLNPEEAAAADEANTGQIDRAWTLWCEEVQQ